MCFVISLIIVALTEFCKMRHFVIALLIALPLSVKAQMAVNYDKKTVAAMAAAYASGAASESYYNQQVQDILRHYNAAEVATAGIYASKFLERKALTDLGVWSSSTENYYYRRIYNMVANRIMPKIWTVAGMMLKSPQNALYWGSYLLKVCDDTKTLCYQFESVVTNSSLTFSDIQFLAINNEVAQILRLSEIGNVDFKKVLDDLSKIPGNFTTDNLKADLDKLYRNGVSLATAGAANIGDALLQSSEFHQLFSGKLGAAIDIIDNYSNLWNSLDKSIGNTLLGMIGGEDNVAGLFQLSDYNLTGWMTDYLSETQGQYFTQRWYIYRNVTSSSGDSRNSTRQVVYEDIFDSYTTDLNVFKGQMNARLSEFNTNEDGNIYYLVSDARKYYQATDATKLNGVETVTISVTCSDGVKLAEGTTSYKCKTCGSSLNSHSKDCAMQTSVTENNLDITELSGKLTEATSKISSLSSAISDLEKENANLVKLIASSSITQAAAYRQQYNSNLTAIAEYKRQLAQWQSQERQYNKAIEDVRMDDDVATDDYYRIPAIMADCRSAFSLTWQGTGSWNGYTYTRKATMPNIEGVITFKATLSISRKPKYFMGIKIHRAILQISWELTSEYSNTQVVEVMSLDPGKSDAEKAEEVNKRISEIARSYPDCQITTEYAKSAPVEENDGDDVQHLLWSSDRLEIAREVDSRITQIYADLVTLEKMMHYKHNIIDLLLSYGPKVNDEQGRYGNIVEQSFRRWRNRAKGIKEEDD